MESPPVPPVPPSSRPDALDRLEVQALTLVAGGDAAGWDALLAELDAAKLDRGHPPVDPSEGRRSTAELRRLVESLRGTAVPAPAPPRTRAGYALEEAHEGDTRVIPAFVAALGQQTGLREAFPDLWAIDAALWEQLEQGDIPTLARIWLESPGRRLVQDLGALRHAPGTFGASDLSLERMGRAAGAGNPAAAGWSDWRELHLALPGAALDAWRPQADPDPVIRALRLLEEGSPISLRGAALAWLLNRAADEPFYAVGGIRRDLREDLPIRLSTALGTWFKDDPGAAISRELETFSLHHAARLFGADTSPDATRAAWSVARWLQRCLGRSPFFGGDEEILAARLRAEPPRLPPNADALHAGRFHLDGGLDVAEIAFMAGVLAHYQRGLGHTLLPTPVPIIHRLEEIAGRPVRSAEEEADMARSAGHDALHWPPGYPIAAPLAARKVMTELRLGWVARVGEAAQLDAIERFARSPLDNEGTVFAIQREAAHLAPAARSRAVEVFRALDATTAPPHVLATLGVCVLEDLDAAAARRVLDLAKSGDPVWFPFVADALAVAAERLDRGLEWKAAMEHLLELMEDTGADTKVRLNAALFALRRASGTKIDGAAGLLERVVTLVSRAPFSEHSGLRRDVRRLGLAPPAQPGGKR
jgi:hypothetical protein